jgi:hypothetical protein
MDKIGGEEQTWTAKQRAKFIKDSTIYIKDTLHLSQQEAMKVAVNFIYKFGLKIK